MATTQSSNINKVADKAHQAIDKAAEAASSLEAKVGETSDNAQLKVDETIDNVKQAGVTAQATVTTYVNDNPLKAIGIAFGVGILASALLRK